MIPPPAPPVSLQLFHVDAFTHKPFAGNPAAVCLLPGPAPEAWMQNVAMEMNLSETAFLFPEGEGFRLRWFTPLVEVALCGHATLASAHILFQKGLVQSEIIRFFTKSGPLTAEKRGGEIQLDFPSKPISPALPAAGVLEAFSEKPGFVGRNEMDYLLEFSSPEMIQTMTPDFSVLGRVEARGIIITSRTLEPGFDFVSRFFAPAVGVNEDPVTGSAHCALGPYWGAQLGKSEMTGYQASRRGGVVRVKVCGSRTLLIGRAVTVYEAASLCL